MSKEIIQAIILKKVSYGDNDLIVTYLNSSGQKRKGFAKNAKNSKKRFSGSLDLFNLVEFEVKYQSSENRLDQIFSSELKNNLSYLRSSIINFNWICLAVEIILELTPEHEAHPEVYQLLLKLIENLNKKENYHLIELVFIIFSLLDIFGYKPEMSNCSRCKKDTHEKNNFVFDSKQGVMICSICLPSFQGDPLTIHPHILNFLKEPSPQLLFNQHQYHHLNIANEECFIILKAFESFLEFTLDKPLKSYPFVYIS